MLSRDLEFGVTGEEAPGEILRKTIWVTPFGREGGGPGRSSPISGAPGLAGSAGTLVTVRTGSPSPRQARSELPAARAL